MGQELPRSTVHRHGGKTVSSIRPSDCYPVLLPSADFRLLCIALLPSFLKPRRTARFLTGSLSWMALVRCHLHQQAALALVGILRQPRFLPCNLILSATLVSFFPRKISVLYLEEAQAKLKGEGRG